MCSTCLDGLTFCVVFGGWLASRIGAERVLLTSMLVWSAIMIIIPFSLALGGISLLFSLRLMLGAFEGMLFPSVHALIAKFVPLEQKARLYTHTHRDTLTHKKKCLSFS